MKHKLAVVLASALVAVVCVTGFERMSPLSFAGARVPSTGLAFAARGPAGASPWLNARAATGGGRRALARLIQDIKALPNSVISDKSREQLYGIAYTAYNFLLQGRPCSSIPIAESLRPALANPQTWSSGKVPRRLVAHLKKDLSSAERDIMATGKTKRCVFSSHRFIARPHNPNGPYKFKPRKPGTWEQGDSDTRLMRITRSGPYLKVPPEKQTDIVPFEKQASGAASAHKGIRRDLTVRRTTDLGQPPYSGYPMEPEVASAGNVVMYSGNVTGAFSTDGGQTFTWVHPDNLFGPIAGGYIGDSVVRFIPQINRFVWLMQYDCAPVTCDHTNPRNTPTNLYRFAAASPESIVQNAAHPGRAWTVWNLRTSVYQATTWFDFPDMAVGAHDLYLTWDLVGEGTENVQIPFASIAAGGNLTGLYFADTVDGIFWRLAQNSGPRGLFLSSPDDAYAHALVWPESSSLIFATRLPHTRLPTNDSGSVTPLGSDSARQCPSDPGTWDCRDGGPGLTGATVTGNQLWVAFNAARNYVLADGSLQHTWPQPHVYIAVFDLGGLASTPDRLPLLQEDDVWNPDVAIVDGFLNTDSTGAIGIAFSYGGVHNAPSPGAGYLTPGHDVRQIAPADSVSSQGQGDYAAIQPAWPDGTDFVTSGYVARNDPSGPTNHWVYARFGR